MSSIKDIIKAEIAEALKEASVHGPTHDQEMAQQAQKKLEDAMSELLRAHDLVKQLQHDPLTRDVWAAIKAINELYSRIRRGEYK